MSVMSQNLFNLFTLESMWKRVGRVKNIWQGDGRTNCLSPFYNLARLTAAIKRRDETNMMRPNPYIDKVYHWTIDITVNLRSSLRYFYSKLYKRYIIFKNIAKLTSTNSIATNYSLIIFNNLLELMWMV